jgi:iron-sulfur cluster insertion protein
MTPQFEISDSAAKRIAWLLAREAEPESTKLRIAVDGGGCNGFQYKFEFTTTTEADDVLLEKDGAKVLVDTTSLEMLAGSVIEFTETLGGAHFEIKNPQAKSSCGCGNSFSV